MAAPLIEVADCTESGNNTATTSWAVSYPAYASGDLLCFHVASDANVTHDWSATGPNGETVVTISDSYGGTAQRISAFYFVGSATTSAGTFTVTPSATEQWTAVVVKVPAGEFDSTTPVQATIGSDNVTTAAEGLATPTWTAGAKSDGRIVVAAAIDTLTTSAAPTGWTALIQRDRGAVGIMVGVRDAGTTSSESIASATFTKSSETHSVIGYVINDPVETFSGSGTPSLPLITSSGSGESGQIGQGGDAAPFPHLGLLFGSGAATYSGSGTPSLPLLTASGSGTKARKGTGTPSLPLVTATGAGTKARKGSGTPSLPLPTAAGTGRRGLKSTGASSLPLITATGAGETDALVTWSGSGTPSLPLLTASGTGTKARKGDGTATLPLLTATGAGTKARTGTGTPSLPLPTATGAGKRGLTSTGTPSLPLLTATGSGSTATTGGGGDPAPFPHLGLLLAATSGNNGSGTPSLPIITASGEGEVVRLPVSSIQTISRRNRPGRGPYSVGRYFRKIAGGGEVAPAQAGVGSGDSSLPLLTAAGSGTKARKGTGAATLPALTGAGSGTKERKGSGAANLPLATAVGSGIKARKGTGTPGLPLQTASGAGTKARKGSGTPSLPLVASTGIGIKSGETAGDGTPSLPILTAAGDGTVDHLDTAQPTGGWAHYFRAEQAALRRKHLRALAEEAEEASEREALAEALETALIADGTATQGDVDRLRLDQIAALYTDRTLLDRRAQRALAYAERSRTELATRLALRELQRQQEDEELAVLLVLAID